MLSACQSWFTKPHLRGPRGLQQLKLRQPVAAGVALRSAKWGGPTNQTLECCMCGHGVQDAF